MVEGTELNAPVITCENCLRLDSFNLGGIVCMRSGNLIQYREDTNTLNHINDTENGHDQYGTRFKLRSAK